MSTLYYAMTEKGRIGPLPLEELPAAGVGPDTYVWCKGMADWEKADNVAEICRFWRNRIYDKMHPAPVPSDTDIVKDNTESEPEEVLTRFGYIPVNQENDDDFDTAPPSMMAVVILLIIFCFPPTGIVALYFAIKTRRTWMEATRADSKNSNKLYSDEERNSLKKMAHEYARKTKMWIGYTISIGLIFYAVIFRHVI